MSEKEYIIDRLKQSFLRVYEYGPTMKEGPFHGPSIMEALEDIDHQLALKRPIINGHTIWELTNHCRFWMEEITKTFYGEKLVDIISSEDWLDSGNTQLDWEDDLNRLIYSFEELISAASVLVDSRVNERISSFFKGQYFSFTFRKMLNGVADHNIYHAGQISMLKK
jgi:uncharacterized damage-inducible protein DinB